jgi:hypothetical protein
VQEHADVVGFMNWRVSIRDKDVGFGKKVARGVGGGQRVLYLEERPAFDAKNRYSMPPSIDLPTEPEAWQNPQAVWEALRHYLPQPEEKTIPPVGGALKDKVGEKKPKTDVRAQALDNDIPY